MLCKTSFIINLCKRNLISVQRMKSFLELINKKNIN